MRRLILEVLSTINHYLTVVDECLVEIIDKVEDEDIRQDLLDLLSTIEFSETTAGKLIKNYITKKETQEQ